jgi:two-component system OmpR family sensor kinase
MVRAGRQPDAGARTSDDGRAPPTRRWRLPSLGLAGSIRSRLVASVVLLLTISGLLSLLAIREVLLLRLTAETDEALRQEVSELGRLLADGRDPRTGQPFDSLFALFDTYFARNVPSSGEALLAFVDGQPYRTAFSRFPLDKLPREMLVHIESASRSLDADRAIGRVPTPLGEASFQAVPVRLGGRMGTFAVVILPAAALAGIGQLQTYGVAAVLGVVALASASAWFLSGRILTPVHALTRTARSISESDLARRVPVEGSSEAAEMARAFNAMLDRLEAVFRTEREFIRAASHELRVPLTVSLGHLGLLDDHPEARRATTALIMDELDRMGRLVDDLRLLAEVEHPDFLQPETIDLVSFTEELTAKATALGSRHWQVDDAAQTTMVADRHRLTEAVMNLAHNAVAHTEPDDTVAIGTAIDGDEVRLWVRDTGVGVPVHDQHRIFDRFRRGTSAHRRYRGAGLGLAIVRAIAEAHVGRVELKSQLGEGATFTIVIPRTRRSEVGRGTNPDR